MKRLLSLAAILFAAAVATPACAPKTGCPANESLKADMSKTKKEKGKQFRPFPQKYEKEDGTQQITPLPGIQNVQPNIFTTMKWIKCTLLPALVVFVYIPEALPPCSDWV